MIGVQFGEKHSYRDWKLMRTEKNIGMPAIKKDLIEIPGADGTLDFTESLTGDVKYDNRRLEFSFFVDESYKKWYSLVSEISNYLHGRRMKIILDDDIGFYYIGRAQVDEFKSNRNIGIITIVCDVEPYKYDVTSSDEDWLWDPFSFEDGIINETKDLVVNGELTVNIYGRRKLVSPAFICECQNDLQCVFEGQTYNFTNGTNYAPNIQIKAGLNTFKFRGNGKVTIEYRGGSL